MNKHVLTLIAVLTFGIGTIWADDAAHSVGIQIGFAEPILRLNTPTPTTATAAAGYSFNESASKLNKVTMNGFKIGVVYDASIAWGLGFSLGMNYTFAYHQDSWNDYAYQEDGTQAPLPYIDYRTRYVYNQGEVFVDWQYKFEMAKQTFLILYTGPTIQTGFYKATDRFRYNDNAFIYGKSGNVNLTTAHYSFEDQQDQFLHHLNVTWGIGAGFQYKQYFVRGGYDFGINPPYSEYSFNYLGEKFQVDMLKGDDRRTRGRLDQWQIKIGMYIWQQD